MIDFKIGKPYSFMSYNCWDYACDIRSQAGIETKMFKPSTIKESFDIIEQQVKRIDHGLTKVESPENFDVVICSKLSKGRDMFHCGVYHDGIVYHCDIGRKQVTFNKYKEFISKFSGLTLWR